MCVGDSQQSDCAQFSFDQCSATDGIEMENLQKLTLEIHNLVSTPCLRAALESSDLVNIEDLNRSVKPNCSPFQVTYSVSSPLLTPECQLVAAAAAADAIN